MNQTVERQNDVIIQLLARSVFGLEKVRETVTRGKRNPDAYIVAYNSLDGAKGVTELAKLAGVSQPTMTVILQSWEQQGIVYDVGNGNKTLYKRILTLPPKTKEKAT